MIVAQRKPMVEILGAIGDARSVAVVGCATCVTVCAAGGKKEVDLLCSLLRIAASDRGGELRTVPLIVERQCDREFVQEVEGALHDIDLVVSLGCGAGVQTIASCVTDRIVIPGLNTVFIGAPQESGVWTELCAACGDCMLGRTAGICPFARCAKNCLNGPCGGSVAGRCEIDGDTDCAWHLIIDRLSQLGRLYQLEEIEPIRDWSGSSAGGPRKIVREDLRL